MKLDSLKKFVSLRESLQKEKSSLEQRLAQIDAALGVSSSVAAASARSAKAPKIARKAKASGKATRVKGARGGNAMSLRDAVLKATSEKPLTKEEILKAVDKLGYKFNTKNPLASVNVVLYSKKQFKQADGKFSPAK
jgi:hypothetical protein